MKREEEKSMKMTLTIHWMHGLHALKAIFSCMQQPYKRVAFLASCLANPRSNFRPSTMAHQHKQSALEATTIVVWSSRDFCEPGLKPATLSACTKFPMQDPVAARPNLSSWSSTMRHARQHLLGTMKDTASTCPCASQLLLILHQPNLFSFTPKHGSTEEPTLHQAQQ